MAIPEAARHEFKRRTAIVESLETGDIRVAMERRDARERTALDLFKAIKAGEAVTPEQIDATSRGAIVREAIKTLQDAGDTDALHDAVSAAEDERDHYRGKERKLFDAAVSGKVPVDQHLEAYLKEAKLADKTTAEWRGLVKRFARWCAEKALRLADIDRKNAGRYVSEEIAEMHPKTAKKHLSAVRGYWDYLARRGLVDTEQSGNPWDRQLQPQRRKKGSAEATQGERPFTPKELNAVLYGEQLDSGDREAGQFDHQLQDAALIGALSGMRLEEIVTLRVGQCAGGWFDIRDAKTQAGVRRVPIHSGLTKLVGSRTKDKKPGDWLFHELANERDAAAVTTKRFTRYRVACGVDDKRDGRRRSLVNFHSFRRWFVSQAEQAGIPETTVAAVVGHVEGRKSITFGVYSGGPSDEQKVACVKAVKLPPPGSAISTARQGIEALAPQLEFQAATVARPKPEQ
ncbi:hypothetical protein X755_02495 [Mesorhizobium sp. LNJC405B00]|nr:hypothetical protein X755_02495 [Mesorhizobium sp. LNJC405B00]